MKVCQKRFESPKKVYSNPLRTLTKTPKNHSLKIKRLLSLLPENRRKQSASPSMKL